MKKQITIADEIHKEALYGAIHNIDWTIQASRLMIGPWFCNNYTMEDDSLMIAEEGAILNELLTRLN